MSSDNIAKTTNIVTDSPRDLSIREKFWLGTIGSPENKDIERLIDSSDTEKLILYNAEDWVARVTGKLFLTSKDSVSSGGYTISHRDKQVVPEKWVTSTVLLDALLEKADPETKKDLVAHGISYAAKIDDTYVQVLDLLNDGTGTFNLGYDTDYARVDHHVITDITNKLCVFIRHGGNMAPAVTAADNKRVCMRNARVMFNSGQDLGDLTPETLNVAMDGLVNGYHKKSISDQLDFKRLKFASSLLEAGAVLEHTVSISTVRGYPQAIEDSEPIKGVSFQTSFETDDTLALALVIDEINEDLGHGSGDLFNTLLERGVPVNEDALAHAVSSLRDGKEVAEKLKGYGIELEGYDNAEDNIKSADVQSVSGKEVTKEELNIIVKPPMLI